MLTTFGTSKYSQVLFAKTSNKETDIDKVRNEIQKSFDEKLKKIQNTAREANKNNSQNVDKKIKEAYTMIQEANRNNSLSFQNADKKIQEANKKIQEANQKILGNSNYINNMMLKISITYFSSFFIITIYASHHKLQITNCCVIYRIVYVVYILGI